MDRNAGSACGVAYRVTDVPRKGNVDRNFLRRGTEIPAKETFPARGTWIEMRKSGKEAATTWDVPRKGNVDRNFAAMPIT